MAILATRLENAGFRVVNFGYPSTSEPMEVLVEGLRAEMARCCGDEADTAHFVTHSMGGVLVRSYLSRQTEAHKGRVVMLSPPSQGSEIVDAFADTPLLRSLLGPAGSRLGTGSAGVTSPAGARSFSLGIITGDRSLNPLGSWLIPGPDDGKVGVERARVEGAADFMVLKRPQFSWTLIRGESNVQGGGGNGSIEERAGEGVGGDGGSPEGDRSARRRRGR